MMKLLCAFVALALLAVPLTGCGGDEGDAAADAHSLKPLSAVFDGRLGPANAGLRLAIERGYFEDLGFDVAAGSPAAPAKTVPYVSSGAIEFGLTQLPQLLIARDNGAPLVAVGSLVPEATAAMIWLKRSRIRGIADLKGKTIAIPGLAFQKALLEAVLRRAGLKLADVEVKRVEYDLVSALLEGRADAIFGGSWNIEGAALEAGGADPVIRRVDDLGVPPYDELVIVARTDLVAEEPQEVRDFMSALARGVADEEKDPRAAVELIEKSFESSPESNRKETEAGVDATLPLLSTGGHMDPGQAREMVDWMYEEGLVRRKLPVSELLTNEYLASP